MNKIRDNLWIGGSCHAGSEEGIKLLADVGITAILNVAAEINDHAAREGPTRCKIGISERVAGDLPQLRLAIRTLANLIEQNETVYVHCAAGANRSPYIVVQYLMLISGRKFDDLLAEVRSLSPSVSSSPDMASWYGRERL